MELKDKIKPKTCVSCGSRLFDAHIVEGVIEIKCKCGILNTFSAMPVNIKPDRQKSGSV